MSYSKLLVALENLINDEVATVPTARNRKNVTSAPTEIGMAAKEDGENASQERDQRIVDLALQAVYKGIGKGMLSFGKGQSWSEKGGNGGKDGGKNPWQKGSGKKGSKGQGKGGKGDSRKMLDVWRDRTHCSMVQERRQQNVYAIGEDDSENIEESADNEEDLQARCLLEESEHEQVISRRDKSRAKKANLASLLCVENSHNSSPKKIVEVKDRFSLFLSRNFQALRVAARKPWFLTHALPCRGASNGSGPKPGLLDDSAGFWSNSTRCCASQSPRGIK